MSFFSGAGGGNNQRQEEDSLNSILHTPALKIELASLVAICSDTMRRELLATFELPTNLKSRAKQKQASAADDLISSEPEPVKKPHYKVLEDAELRRQLQEDVESTQTQGFKRAALTYFDRWQIDVLRRLGEVLKVRPDAVKQARAKAKSQADAKAKERRDIRYWNWANGVDEADAGDIEQDSKWSVPLESFNMSILNMERSKKVLLVDSVLLLLLSLEHYTAHSRVLMLRLTESLQLPASILTENESKIAQGLLASAASLMQADESTKKKAAADATERRWKVGLATVAGAALIGVTGGLAAPFLAAGLGSIMGGLGLGAVATLLGPLATNMVLVGGLFGAYGGKMTGRIMEKYAQEVRDFKFLPTSSRISEPPRSSLESNPSQIQDLSEQNRHKLRVSIGISGWLGEASDITAPWLVLSNAKTEPFALRYEMEALMQLGQSLATTIKNFAWDFATWQLLSSIVAGLWPIALLRNARMLDNPFAIAKNRSTKAGKVLADALINKVQGERPVTLIGYSLGARVIYSCLLELAEQNAFGLVESAMLIGAPAPSNFWEWRKMRATVSGRLVNVYSTDDFMLGFLYRASSAQMGVAGLSAVEGVNGIENFDYTDMVKGHTRYRFLVGSILQRAGFEDLDMDEVIRQQNALKIIEDERVKTANTQKTANALGKEVEGGRVVMVSDDGAELPAEAPPTYDSLLDADTTTTIASQVHHNARLEDEQAIHPPAYNAALASVASSTGSDVEEVNHRLGPIQLHDEESDDDGPQLTGGLTAVAPEPEP